MRAPNPGASVNRCWTLAGQAMMLVAAALVLSATLGVSSAKASPQSAVSADTRPILAPRPAAEARNPAAARRAVAPDMSRIATLDPTPLRVTCSLPYVNGKQGSDCVGKNQLNWVVSGDTSSAVVAAELLGLDANGDLINSILNVKKGATAELGSRLSPSDWKFTYNGKDYAVFAPIPMLHVTVMDQGQKAEAFCTNVPWVDVKEPSGGVVAASAGNSTEVFAVVPLTNVSALELKVDGVDLFADGVVTPPISPASCTVASPCSGTATINGNTVGVENLVVDIASGIDKSSSNTVRATLTDLACGGHYVRVESSKLPGSLKTPTSPACDVDDLIDQGGSSVFAITITDPTPGEVTTTVPTPVAGSVCGGTQIVNVNINGKDLPVTGQTHTVGDGLTSGDVWTVPIDTTLAQTDLNTALIDKNDTSLGTFDAGSNRLAASARESGGTRTYASVIFATGTVAPIGIDVNAQVFQASALQGAVNKQLKSMVEARIQNTLTPTETTLNNAFIVGISADGTQTLFNKLCTTPLNDPNSPDNGKTPGQIFSDNVEAAILSINTSNNGGPPTIQPSVPCAADPVVTLTVTDVTVGNTVTCDTTFYNGKFHVTLGLPAIHVDVHAYGTGGGWGADVCGAGVKVEGDAYADVTGTQLDFDVTESNLLNNTFSNSNFTVGTTATSNGTVSVDFCGFSVFCNVLVTIFTFGAVDINPHIDFSTVQNFSAQIGANQPDPVTLKKIKVDETVIANFDQKVSGAVTEVHITPQGITAGLAGKFATTVVDADVASTPGVVLTNPPVPTMASMQTQGAEDALIGLSSDAINMMFASLTAAGKLRPGTDPQGCIDTGATIGSLLPPDQGPVNGCDTLVVDDPVGAGTAGARGYCHAIKGDDCDLLTMTGTSNDGLFTSTERGVCWGAKGAVCTSVVTDFDLVKLTACSITPYLNLEADQKLLFCAKGDVPPRMLFPNSGGIGDAADAALRLNDLTVALVIDRTGQGVEGLPALSTVPGCFAAGASVTADCTAFAACLDLNLDFSMEFLTCTDGKPGFQSTFKDIQLLNRQVGVVCSGATSPTTDSDVLTSASNETITVPLGQNAGTLSPPICGAGLDLGGVVTCASPQVLTLMATAPKAVRDYIAITCGIQ